MTLEIHVLAWDRHKYVAGFMYTLLLKVRGKLVFLNQESCNKTSNIEIVCFVDIGRIVDHHCLDFL
jgi:hypothetical protein